MIKMIHVINHKNERLDLELSNPWKTGIIVEKVEGLGYPKTSMNTTNYATFDGSVYSSSRVDMRSIILTLAPISKPTTVEDSRRLIYEFFPIKQKITIVVDTDSRTAQIEGYVETNEADIFTSHETCTITVICPDPYFYEQRLDEVIFSGVVPLFEFPFSNESLHDDMLAMSDLVNDRRVTIDYKGDSEIGMITTIHALGKYTGITLYNSETKKQFIIDTNKIEARTGKPIDKGDDIIISSYSGNKYVRLFRNGTYTNMLWAIDKKSDWLTLTSGKNTFGFFVTTGQRNIEIVFTYRNAYGGI